MIKSAPYMWVICAVFIVASIGTASALGEDWIIDGDKVYIDDSNAYISAEPHTLTNSGYLNVTVISKGYAGNIDLAFLIFNGDLKPTSADVSINGNSYTSIVNQFDKHTYFYDGFDTVYLGRNLPVIAGTEYNLRVWIDVPARAINSKYGIALKPSSKTLSESIAQSYFYYLDPWVNTTGGDHEYEDWIVDDGDTIGGIHYNIKNFTITSGYTVDISTGTGLSISANLINISGTLDGSGYGRAGGAWSTGTGASGTSPGGGSGGAPSNGAGGGGAYGGAGGNGAGTGGAGGAEHGSETANTIAMGGGGGGGSADYGSPNGGYGGGYVILNATHILISGTINVDGNNGAGVGGLNGGGGGGGAGGVLMNAYVVNISGTVNAIGGNGGVGSNIGGGGGGGRIKIFYIEYINTSSMSVAGGTGGGAGASGTIHSLYDPTNLTLYASYGYVFESDNTPITEASVTLSNDTWTQSVTTDSLGFWYTTELSTTGLYEYSVTKYSRDDNNGTVYIYSTATNNTDFTLTFGAPELYLPSNTSTTYTTYPPLTSDITFSCQDIGAPQYRLEVAEDKHFNINVIDTHTSTNTSTQTLIVNKQYYWRVYAYDGSTYSDSSDIYNFNLTGNTTLTGSAIEGVVYANGDGYTALSGAEVIIWNATWSDSAITGSNGYYVFEDLADGQVYSLQAKADRYLDSSVAIITAASDPITQNFYLLEDLTDTEWWHYVSFTVQNFWGTTYENVATTVYIGDSVTASDSGETESDGVVAFHMNQNVKYRLTFIDATQGINQEFEVYPIATKYTIYVSGSTEPTPPTPVTDVLTAKVEGVRINSTDGYINFTWSDISVETSTIYYWINDTDGNILYSTSETTINMTNSQIVDATNDRYIVHWVGTHPVIGTVEHVQTIAFHGGRRVDLGWAEDWMYAVTAFAVLIFLGTMFGAKTAHYGAISVVMFGWFFVWIGWFTSDNTSILLIILATVITFGWAMRKGEVVKP